jgi:hypothetical protein
MIYRETTFAKMHDDRRLLAYERTCITKRTGIQFDRRIPFSLQKLPRYYYHQLAPIKVDRCVVATSILAGF